MYAGAGPEMSSAVRYSRYLGTGLGTTGFDFSVAFLIRDRGLQDSGPNPNQE